MNAHTQARQQERRSKGISVYSCSSSSSSSLPSSYSHFSPASLAFCSCFPASALLLSSRSVPRHQGREERIIIRMQACESERERGCGKQLPHLDGKAIAAVAAAAAAAAGAASIAQFDCFPPDIPPSIDCSPAACIHSLLLCMHSNGSLASRSRESDCVCVYVCI